MRGGEEGKGGVRGEDRWRKRLELRGGAEGNGRGGRGGEGRRGPEAGGHRSPQRSWPQSLRSWMGRQTGPGFPGTDYFSPSSSPANDRAGLFVLESQPLMRQEEALLFKRQLLSEKP